MIKFIDDIINSITMYRLVLYSLIVIVVYAVICGFLGVLPYSGVQLIGSAFLLLVVCRSTNLLFSKLFKASTNVESWRITALILFLLFMPVVSRNDALTLIVAGVIAMASKYILAINRKHIFNPAAIAAVVLSLNANSAALWWVGSPVILPVVLVVGMLVVRKVRKFSMFFAFIAASLAGTFILAITTKSVRPEVFVQMLTSGPIIFLGTIMLIEPLTMPSRRKLQIVYGAIVGVLSSLQFNIGSLYSTPELAIVIGNIFAYVVSPKQKLFLSLKQKQMIGKDTYEFVFESENLRSNSLPEKPLNLSSRPSEARGGISYQETILVRLWREILRLRFRSAQNDKDTLKNFFKPGQYMEWTLPHRHPDSRGVRRYFTIASSPTEENIKIGVKIIGGASSFKNRLLSLEKGGQIIASQLSGDFVLPENAYKKLVFIAGGIGVTPFRSMVMDLIDKKENRDIVLFYFNKTEREIAYKDVFDRAEKEIGLKTIFVLTDKEHVSSDWKGKAGRPACRTGRLDGKMLSEEVPDYKNRVFYLSGPNTMVDNYKHALLTLGVERSNIKIDYFPGY